MKKMNHVLAAVAVAASMGGLAGGVQAAAVTEQTYYFYGSCADCAPNASPGNPLATLVLTGEYVPGSTLSLPDLVSFSYVGSDKVYAYTVTAGSMNTPVNYTAYFMAGAMDASPGAKDFMIEFDDGLRFQSYGDGAWYTCASGPNGYYSGTCDFRRNDDYGFAGGTWNTPGNQTPEPATFALVGLAALGLARRRQAPA